MHQLNYMNWVLNFMKKFIFLILFLALIGGGYYYYTQNSDEISTTSYEYINIEKGNIKKLALELVK